MSDQTKLERTLRILQRLMTHSHVTIKELYDLFDRRESVRTLQRSLAAIENANIPLKITRGAHGEKAYSLHRAFDFIPVGLSSDETLAALLLGQFAEYFEGTPVGDDVARVFEKIEQLVPPGSIAISTAFRDVSEALVIHDPGRANMRPRGQILRELFRGILERRVCHIHYSPTGKNYDIHPYSLLLHGGQLYAVAYQPRHQNFIYLALSRIERLTLKDDTFVRDAGFRLRDFMCGNFGLWSETPETVRIRFDRTVAASITERTWHPSQSLETLPGGDVLLTMQVGLCSELLAWVLRWERYAEVLEPASFRARVEEALLKTLARYRQKTVA